jgi:NMT1/THI5 like
MSQVPPGPRASGAAKPVSVIVFPGGFNWPIWVAQERGLFAARGIAVDVAATPGSVFQWTRLAMGYSNLAITLMDQVVAYHEGQGEVPVLVPDAVAVMAADARVMPALITLPEIRSYSDLRAARFRSTPRRQASPSCWSRCWNTAASARATTSWCGSAA